MGVVFIIKQKRRQAVKVFKTTNSDVEQTLEQGRAHLYLHGDMSESVKCYSKNMNMQSRNSLVSDSRGHPPVPESRHVSTEGE